MNKFFSRLQKLWYGSLLGIVTLIAASILLNSTSLSAVNIKLLDGKEDYFDQRIPLISKAEEKLPDYKVEYYADGRWKRIGTKPNTSATDWIAFPISDQTNFSLV